MKIKELKKEEEIIKKFSDQLNKEKEDSRKIIEFKKEKQEEIIEDEVKKEEVKDVN